MSDRAVLVRADQASTTMTADQSGTAWLCDRYTEVTAIVTAANVSGTTPNLEVQLQTSADASTWVQIGSDVANLTAAGTSAGRYSTIGKYVRLQYNLTGTTPSFDVTSDLVFKT